MRIATWNLEHGRFKADTIELQQQLLEQCGADVKVLTEVPASMSASVPGSVLSPVKREGKLGPEAWVAIIADDAVTADDELPFNRMAAAATCNVGGESLLVYGSVLPWNAAASQADYLLEGRDADGDLFAQVLAEQVDDIRRLRRAHPGHTLIWAGDFNQPLNGPNSGFSNAHRELLSKALDDLGLIAWNRYLAHSLEGCHAIDLICGPVNRPAIRVERFDPTVDGQTLSDHAGYVVEI